MVQQRFSVMLSKFQLLSKVPDLANPVKTIILILCMVNLQARWYGYFGREHFLTQGGPTAN